MVNAYDPDSPDGGAYFDHARALALLHALVACGDRYVIEHDPPVADLGALAAHYAVAIEPDPPQGVKVYRDRALVVAVDCVDYMAVGGPTPYHDQLLWQVFVRPELADDLLRDVPAALARAGCPVDHLKALPEPSPPPPRRSLWNLFR